MVVVSYRYREDDRRISFVGKGNTLVEAEKDSRQKVLAYFEAKNISMEDIPESEDTIYAIDGKRVFCLDCLMYHGEE
jgi:hypothetical protein